MFDMWCIIWILVCVERMFDECGRSFDFDISFCRILFFGKLCFNVLDNRVKVRMNEFGVIFVYDFFLDYGVVFCLLCKFCC